MEGESRNCEIKNETKEAGPISTSITNACNVLFAVWLRCAVQAHNGFKRIILDGRPGFLFYFRFFLVILYLAYSNHK